MTASNSTSVKPSGLVLFERGSSLVADKMVMQSPDFASVPSAIHAQHIVFRQICNGLVSILMGNAGEHGRKLGNWEPKPNSCIVTRMKPAVAKPAGNDGRARPRRIPLKFWELCEFEVPVLPSGLVSARDLERLRYLQVFANCPFYYSPVAVRRWMDCDSGREPNLEV
jgi:hypothetical protein